MKKSVMKASLRLAKNLWRDFEELNDDPEMRTNGRQFKYVALYLDTDGSELQEGSFEILYTRTVGEQKSERKIFRFLIRDCRREIQWDEAFVTI